MLNHLKKFLRNIICTSLLLTGSGYSQFVFTPFENESSFKGTWNLSQEVPNYIAAYFREFYKVNVLSSTAFLSLAEKNNIPESERDDFQSYRLIANEIGFKYLVKGRIIDFSVSRFIGGESSLASYEAYNCEINISLQIFDFTSNASVYTGNIEASVSNKGLGFNLFGSQSDEKKQYLALNNIKFGSEEFNKTIVGETIFQLCQDLASDVKSANKELFYPKKENKPKTKIIDETLDEIKIDVKVIEGQILTYDEKTGEAFINLGSSSGVNEGDELTVYAQADSLFDPTTKEFLGLSDKNIATLEIVEIRGDKLSLAIIKKNRNLVQKGLGIRKLFLQTTTQE